MKFKKPLAIVLSFAFFLYPITTLAAESNTGSGIKAITDFQDVLRTNDNYVPISYLQQTKVIGGYSDGTFKPNNPINRAEVLKVILQGSKIESSEQFDSLDFPDVKKEDWFARFVVQAKKLGIIKGDATTGHFSGGRQVNKAEFLKMLLVANRIKEEALKLNNETVLAEDVPNDAWFAPYMGYAIKTGIISKNEQGKLEPNKALTRGEVAKMMYLLLLIKNSNNTQFLLHRAEAELSQIEVYIAANKVMNAKRASELAVDLTQQAIKNLPEDKVVLGAGKLAKSYDWLVDSFIFGIQKDFEKAEEFANKAIKKATEAWEVNNATQPISRHIKDRAREILKQVGGTEQ